MQLPENARYELSGGAANERSDLIPGGSASAETALSLQRKAACRSKNLQAAFLKIYALLHPRFSQNQVGDDRTESDFYALKKRVYSRKFCSTRYQRCVLYPMYRIAQKPNIFHAVRRENYCNSCLFLLL